MMSVKLSSRKTLLRKRFFPTSQPKAESETAKVESPEAQLTSIHDLAAFTDRASESARYPLDALYYDSKMKRLIASNNFVIVCVPLHGGSLPDLLLDATQVQSALDNDMPVILRQECGSAELFVGDRTSSKTYPATVQTDRKYAPVREGVNQFMPDWQPDLCIWLNVEIVKSLLDYAAANDMAKVCVAIKNKTDECDGRYWEALFWNPETVIFGALMGLTVDDQSSWPEMREVIQEALGRK